MERSEAAGDAMIERGHQRLAVHRDPGEWYSPVFQDRTVQQFLQPDPIIPGEEVRAAARKKPRSFQDLDLGGSLIVFVGLEDGGSRYPEGQEAQNRQNAKEDPPSQYHEAPCSISSTHSCIRRTES